MLKVFLVIKDIIGDTLVKKSAGCIEFPIQDGPAPNYCFSDISETSNKVPCVNPIITLTEPVLASM